MRIAPGFMRIDPRGARLTLKVGLGGSRRVQDAEPERQRTASYRLADPARAEQPKRPATQLEAEQLFRVPAGPLPSAHQVHPLDQVARGREDERPGKVSRGFGEHARCVGDEHVAHLGGDEIDVVIADGDVRDDTKVREMLELGSTDPA